MICFTDVSLITVRKSSTPESLWVRITLTRNQVWLPAAVWEMNLQSLFSGRNIRADPRVGVNRAKEGKAPGRCGIPAEIWKHTWRYESLHLDFLRRENSVPKPVSNKNTQQPIFHVPRELFTWLVPVPYAGVSPGAYKELRILSSSL